MSAYYVRFSVIDCSNDIIDEINQAALYEVDGVAYRMSARGKTVNTDEDDRFGRDFARLSKGNIWCDDDELGPIVAVLQKHGINHSAGEE